MTTHELCKFIINKFCNKPISWPREIKLAKKLISHISDEKFWSEFELGFKINSLAWFLTGSGKHDLGMGIGEFKLANQVKEEYNVGDVKFGDDVIIHKTRKPKSLRDFLKN